MKSKAPTPLPGLLVVVEGLDGAGKSTQIELLQRWLETQCYSAVSTRRRESKLLAKSIARARKHDTLTALTYSLIHLADFAERLETVITPALAAGQIALVDQYIYTSFVRDTLRGLDPKWVRRIYEFAPKPDVVLFMRIPPAEAIRRASLLHKTPDYTGAGLDLGLAPSPKRSRLKYVERQAAAYEALGREFGFVAIDGTASIPQQQREMRRVLSRVIRKRYRSPIAVVPGSES